MLIVEDTLTLRVNRKLILCPERRVLEMYVVVNHTFIDALCRDHSRSKLNAPEERIGSKVEVEPTKHLIGIGGKNKW